MKKVYRLPKKAKIIVAQAYAQEGLGVMCKHITSNQYPRTAGLLTKLCVALQIESVFVPAHEPYRNGDD